MTQFSHTFEQLIFRIWKQTSDSTKENARTKDVHSQSNNNKKHARLEMIKRNTGKKRALVHGYYNIFRREIIICYCIEASRARVIVVVVPVSRILYTHIEMYAYMC